MGFFSFRNKSRFVTLSSEELNYSAFRMIAKDWLQITTKADDRCNTMTASWGGVGQMWGKDAAFIFIRPSRFTKTLIDKTDRVTLQILPETLRRLNSYFGKASGFHEDKIKNSGLTLRDESGDPYFEESDIVMFCKKMYVAPLLKEGFIDESLIGAWYPEKDFHSMYVVAIEKIMVSNDFLKRHPHIKSEK